MPSKVKPAVHSRSDLPTYSLSKLNDIYDLVVYLSKRVSSIRKKQKTMTFEPEPIIKLNDYIIDLLLSSCYYSLQEIASGQHDEDDIQEIQRHLQVLIRGLASLRYTMSIRKETAELSKLSGPYRTTDSAKAAAWEGAGFAPAGTTYISPEELPQNVPNLEDIAKEVGIARMEPEEVRQKQKELSKLTVGPYFSPEKLEEILSDPEKKRRAIALRLITAST
jgi:hypothetical protein